MIVSVETQVWRTYQCDACGKQEVYGGNNLVPENWLRESENEHYCPACNDPFYRKEVAEWLVRVSAWHRRHSDAINQADEEWVTAHPRPVQPKISREAPDEAQAH
jgi:ribosomal protein L37AE/L43A